jgi:Bacterial Ig-like domain (group 3)
VNKRLAGALGLLACAVLAGGLAAGASAPAVRAATGASATSPIGGSWSKVTGPLPGWAALKSAYGTTPAVSCATAGNCLAVGGYQVAGSRTLSMVDAEVNGKWANVEELPGFAALNQHAPVDSTSGAVTVSCPAAGDCTVAGYFTEANYVQHAYVADETTGKTGVKWRTEEIPHLAVLNAGKEVVLRQISCASPGNCAVVGFYTDAQYHHQAFVAMESNGTWSAASRVVPLAYNAGGDASANTVSCPAVNHCVLGGYTTYGSGHTQSWISYQRGTASWNGFQPNGTTSDATNTSSGVNSVSCYSAGNCAIVGTFVSGGHEIPYTDNVSGNVWDTYATSVTGLPTTANAYMESVACPSTTECAAVGYMFSSTADVAFTIDEGRGSWGSVSIPPGTGSMSVPYAVSCGMPGDCATTGMAVVGKNQTQVAFTADELSYYWGGITPVPGLSALKAQVSLASDVSCPAPGNCAVVGNYLTPSGQRVPFVTNRVWTDPTTTVVKAKAASAKYGAEQTDPLTATVTARADVAPGTVTFKAGTAVLCTARLKFNGTGVDAATCTLAAKRLGVGAYIITATYNGAPGYGKSTASLKLTVTH